MAVPKSEPISFRLDRHYVSQLQELAERYGHTSHHNLARTIVLRYLEQGDAAETQPDWSPLTRQIQEEMARQQAFMTERMMNILIRTIAQLFNVSGEEMRRLRASFMEELTDARQGELFHPEDYLE